MTDLENEERFWNNFAREYFEIQQESFTTIAEDVTNYLLSINLFPCRTLVDIAGGYGKYMDNFLPYVEEYMLVDLSSVMLQIAKERNVSDNIQYIQADQMIFCLNSKENQYDFVYSAMNPALTKISTIQEFYRISKKEVLLLYVTIDEDTIFSPLERVYHPEHHLSQMSKKLKEWLTSQKIPWYVKEFSYEEQTLVNKEFVLDYFKEEKVTYPILTQKIEEIFEKQTNVFNKHKIQFELLRIVKK